MTRAPRRLRQRLLILLFAAGGAGLLAFALTFVLTFEQLFDRFIPENRALRDVESRSAQLIQTYYQYTFTPDLVVFKELQGSVLLLRQSLDRYARLAGDELRKEQLVNTIRSSVDELEEAGYAMSISRQRIDQIYLQQTRLGDEIERVFKRYQDEVSVDLGRSIDNREWDRLTRQLLPELRMIKSVQLQYQKLLLEIRAAQIDTGLDNAAKIEALQRQINRSNTLFELFEDNDSSRAWLSTNILVIYAKMRELIEQYEQALQQTRFALTLAEQSGIDLNLAIGDAIDVAETSNWGELRRSLILIGSLLFVTLTVGFALVYFGLDRLLQPLESLQRNITRMGEGDLSRRLATQRDDEIGHLGHAFNRMAEKLEDAERRKQKFIDQLEQQNSQLERFTYTVSHELKAPLVTMSGFIGHLQKDIVDGNEERVRFDMERITEAIETMGAQLDDLLELSRVGHAANPPSRISIRDLCLKQMQSMEALIEARDALIELGDDMPDAWADEARIGEAIRNLIENGIKFTPAGRQPYLRISAEAKNGQLLCRVQDNGIGIEPRFHDRVFGLFDRLDNSVPGTGIGLAMVRRIIETHDGKIWIDSTLDGQGSCFCFTLPLAQGG